MRSALFWDFTQHRIVVTDVSGQLICLISKDQALQPIYCTETSETTILRRVKYQKSADAIYNSPSEQSNFRVKKGDTFIQ
jgi:hypothetical protein